MADSVAFANRGVITVAGTGGTVPTVVTLAVVKDVEITWSAEHVPLYGWGSIRRQGVAKHSEKVGVKIGYMKFNPTVTAGWQFHMLSTVSTAGVWTAPTGVVTDSNAVRTFTLTAQFMMEDGTKMLGTISEVFFPDLPFKASEGQWVRVDMSGEGATVVFTNPA